MQGIPKKMKELEFAHVMMVGTAANMAVYVLRDTEEEDQAIIICVLLKNIKQMGEFKLFIITGRNGRV